MCPREQPTVVLPSSHEGLLLLLAILYTVVAVILITHGDSETPPRICARPGDDAELPGRLTERCHRDQGPSTLREGAPPTSARGWQHRGTELSCSEAGLPE